jgi:formamidopyrimidine-DNA glycosylase
VLHLMIAGRLRLARPGHKPAGGKNLLLALEFEDVGTIALTEQGSKKRASLAAVAARADLQQFDRGGLEPLDLTRDAFRERLTRENRTLKRTLTDPRIFSGIGNAYSDEILFASRLSPTQRTHNLDADEVERLQDAIENVLRHWIDVSRREVGDGFPDKVTAFRPGMAVHGRYREPCLVCRTPIQRIRYAENECNYCPECQTAGKLLADRGLSQLLGKDWPRTWEELEERRGGGG